MRGSKLHGSMITEMLSPEYIYLKRSRRAMYYVIAEHENGRIFGFAEAWRDMSWPKIMNDDEVDLFTASVSKNPCEKNERICQQHVDLICNEEGSSVCFRHEVQSNNTQQLYDIIC
jgi:hypothetical protein